MKKRIKIAIVTVVALMLFATVFPLLIPKEERVARVYQHEEDKLADPSIGVEKIDESGLVDESFQSHLPLVIVDVDESKIHRVLQMKQNEKGEYVKRYIDPNDTNPWADMAISIIDNKSGGTNTIMDAPEFQSDGLIKIRGVSSAAFNKKQYGIKLMNEDEEREASLLGMEADEDWVLSNSELDLSGIRNYMALNIGGQIFPNTPEAKFCEVVFHVEDEYRYKGLYLLVEKIKRADGRVQMDPYKEDVRSLNYIICRDRWAEGSTMLSTWASDQQLCYGYFTLVYPKEKNISKEKIHAIGEELTAIEKVLFSEDPEVFQTYGKYIDVDSFVDYFLINELLMNYDAGNNSTYYYKTREGKLAMGILWDYDNGLDNYSLEVSGMEYAAFIEKPWFQQLTRDPQFNKKLVMRYKELRKEYFSDEYVNEFLDRTLAYLGKASERNYSRWIKDYNENHLLDIAEDPEEVLIDRNMVTVENEIQRVKDTYHLHAKWMDKHLDSFLQKYEENITDIRTRNAKQLIAILALTAMLSMIILVTRVMKGNIR